MSCKTPAYLDRLRLPVIALAGLVLLLTASTGDAQLKIVTTTTDLASIAEAIGGEHVEVASLARGTDDPHHIRPRPAFSRLIAEADILIEVGLELEHGWLPNLVANARNPRIQSGRAGRMDASRGIDLIGVAPGPVDHHHRHGHAHAHGAGNPHYLLDPASALIVADNLLQRLQYLDEENRESYEANREIFRAKLESKIEEWETALAPYRGTHIVTYHASYDYFARRFGFEIIDTVEPSPGIEPTPRHISRLIPQMREKNVRMIWSEPVRPTRLLARLAEETGATIVELAEFPGAVPEIDSYIDLIEHNVQRILEAME